MRPLLRIALCLLLGHAAAASASEIGVTPVAVHLDQANDRAAVTVVNSGTEPVIMQVEMVGWRRTGSVDEDLPTSDMVINPSVFTIAPGRSQLVRVGLRRNVPLQREGTYRIVLREVAPAPVVGETRVSGQVRVLMALRVPIYVAPAKVIRAAQWQADRHSDGSVTASLINEGNVHVRIGSMRLRATEGQAVRSEQAMAVVVFPGEHQSFRIAAPLGAGNPPMTLEVTTDQGVENVPVTVARR